MLGVRSSDGSVRVLGAAGLGLEMGELFAGGKGSPADLDFQKTIRRQANDERFTSVDSRGVMNGFEVAEKAIKAANAQLAAAESRSPDDLSRAPTDASPSVRSAAPLPEPGVPAEGEAAREQEEQDRRVRIRAEESRIGDLPSPGHVMATTVDEDGNPVHSSFQPEPGAPAGERIGKTKTPPFPDASKEVIVTEKPGARPTEEQDKYTKRQLPIDEKFDESFIDPDKFAAAVAMADRSEPGVYRLATVEVDPRDPTQQHLVQKATPTVNPQGEPVVAVTARNCVTDLVQRLVDAGALTSADLTALGMPNGQSVPGRDVTPQRLVEFLRRKQTLLRQGVREPPDMSDFRDNPPKPKDAAG